MAALKALLGDKLTKKGEEVDVESLSKEGFHIGLYFSAHWCPPCRGFTPKLAEWYKEFQEKIPGKMEIVFVSSDSDENAFNEYYESMPWMALPYADRDRKAKLSKKMKVDGIPTFTIIDAVSGKVVCKSGREGVMKGPMEEFPWKPVPLSELLKGPVLTKSGEVEMADALAGKVTGFYFSAHWCPPCRGFTPELVTAYNKMKEAGKNFEIVFVSGDNSEEEFDSYYGEMPWCALPFEDKRGDALNSHFEVNGIPTLVIVDENKEMITDNGRSAVGADPEGNDFPWIPKPLNPVIGAHISPVNEAACLMYFTGGEEAEVKKSMEILEPVAGEYKKEFKAKSGGENELPELHFFYESSESADLIKSIRSFASFGDKTPLVVVINIPNQEKFILEKDSYTADDIKDIVAKVKSESLEMQPLTPKTDDDDEEENNDD